MLLGEGITDYCTSKIRMENGENVARSRDANFENGASGLRDATGTRAD